VRGEIVEHDMDVERGLDTRIKVPEEGDEVLRPVLRRTASEHLSVATLSAANKSSVPCRTWWCVRRSG
jgi:hypothetical protein